ncbi:MAG: hypothetical protein SVK44_07570 [Nitrospirota bacterium]|nr:hypothetical protein [Nitrospirota bacterium]
MYDLTYGLIAPVAQPVGQIIQNFGVDTSAVADFIQKLSPFQDIPFVGPLVYGGMAAIRDGLDKLLLQ